MKTVDFTINIDELDISYSNVPEQKQTLEQEPTPAHIEFNYIKFRGVDISDLIDESEIIEYLKDQRDF